MAKIDFTKELGQLYRPSAASFTVVDVPPMTYLQIDGHGDPNTAPEYSAAVAALYAVAYRIKFISKAEEGKDYVVPPLEGLWWAADMRMFTTVRDKATWDWTMLSMLPDWISPQIYERAVDAVRRKADSPALSKLRAAAYHEGLVAQILHVGAYDDEGPVLERLHGTWLAEHGYVENGKHHEIYLSDPRRVAPEKLRTVLRQPIRKR